MKILVIGGMHGNEPLGPAVVRLFQDNPVSNVDVVIANQLALNMDVRFVEQDLNRSFPGRSDSLSSEEQRAAELVELCRPYDLVLDFHNTHCPDNDCAFVGQDSEDMLYNTSAWLGLTRVIIADYDCLNKYAPNCLSIEISLDSDSNDSEYWYRLIKKLATVKTLQKRKIERYRFVYRISLEDRDAFKLQKANLQAFRAIDEQLAQKLRVVSPAYPIFIADKYTPYNFGGLLNKIDQE